jgi:hypothetical protein
MTANVPRVCVWRIINEKLSKMEETSKNKETAQLGIGAVSYRYYNSGDILGVVGVPVDKIKHQDGEHTFLVGREPKYQWIRTIDLYDNREEAKKSEPAQFYNGR